MPESQKLKCRTTIQRAGERANSDRRPACVARGDILAISNFAPFSQFLHIKGRNFPDVFQLNLFYRGVPKIATITKAFDTRLANRPFLVFGFRELWRSTMSARVPESQILKMVIVG